MKTLLDVLPDEFARGEVNDVLNRDTTHGTQEGAENALLQSLRELANA